MKSKNNNSLTNEKKKMDKNHQKALDKQKELLHKEMELKQDENIKSGLEYKGDAYISLQHINKIYPNHVQAVYDFNLDIKEKEFIVFVGPSGCGKSTTLRMIAGLEDITYGNLYMNKCFANTLLPKSRGCAMVFQSYALYPNMTVYDNMAFSLKVRHEDKNVINEKVIETAKVLELSDYLGRKPSELSGGQRQRVALGRAIVRDAKIFLMDEPLSNLDAKLRVQMRTEIVGIHKRLGSTTIYVTHDQTEAMTMADRIVVMKDGYIQQIGTPKEIYNKPANVFVATFIGAPAMNLIKCKYSKGKITLPNNIEFELSKEQKEEYKNSYLKEIELIKEEITDIVKNNASLQDKEQLETNKLYKSKSFKKRIPDIIKINEDKINSLKNRIKDIEKIIQSENNECILGVRPEDLVTIKHSKIIKNVSNTFPLLINQAELLGNEYFAHSELDNKKIVAKVNADEDVEENKEINFCINLSNIHLFDKISEKKLF